MTAEGFFNRWKEGIQKVSPLQQAWISMMGFGIELTGICWGFLYGMLVMHQTWISIILGGALIVTGMAALSNMQRINILSRIEKAAKKQFGDEKVIDEKGGNYIG